MISPDRFGSLPCEPPTDSCLRACERRSFLITPDRRSFIQSMNQEAAKRITGNAVPVHAAQGVFAYTFPTQVFNHGAMNVPSISRYHTGTMGTPRAGAPPQQSDGGSTGAIRGRRDEELSYGTPQDSRTRYATDDSQSGVRSRGTYGAEGDSSRKPRGYP